MRIREYHDNDIQQVEQIWKECGWLEGKREPLDILVKNTEPMVAELDGNVECLVVPVGGSIQYQEEELQLNCIAAVTTGIVGRRQGIAGRLTSTVIAREAEAGAKVSCLGIFEQGFYNKLGFGNGAMDIITSFYPGDMDVPIKPRIPIRLTEKDKDAMYDSRIRRMKRHGGVNLDKGLMDHEISNGKCFGLGYKDSDGSLGHHFFMTGLGKESGPWRVQWMVYRNYRELLELLGLIQGLGDQAYLIRMNESPDIQLQDFMKKPLSHRQISRGGRFATGTVSFSYWQMRMNDIPACFAAMKMDKPTFRFNLDLTDPIERYLTDSPYSWKGTSGNYVVEIGQNSSAEKGHDPDLRTLKCSVNQLTRLWLGLKKASYLNIAGDFDAPQELLEALDRTIDLPLATPDWMF